MKLKYIQPKINVETFDGEALCDKIAITSEYAPKNSSSDAKSNNVDYNSLSDDSWPKETLIWE